MLRVVIIDDETRSRETIREMLDIYCADIEVVAEGHDVKSGIQVIKQHNPDLVLLDIKMPDGSGFDLIRQIMPVKFKLIFITAFEEYAIRAFKFNALDYITKPIDPTEMQAAIEKAVNAVEGSDLNNKIKTLMEQYMRPAQTDDARIVLKTADVLHLVELKNIVRVTSERNYTVFILNEGENIMVSKSIKEYTEFLEKNNFFRIHQSHLINLVYLRKFVKDELVCVMKDNSEVPVSYRKKEELLKRLNSMN